MIALILCIIFVSGIVMVFKEYHYILDYKRDERIFYEYKNKSKEELNDIVDNTDNCGF